MSSTTNQDRIPIDNPVFDQMEEAKKAASEFLKVAAGQTVAFEVDPNSIRIAEREYEGTKSKVGEYKVKVIGSGETKTLRLSLKWAVALNALVKKGFLAIEMSRKGAGRQDTSYTFVPV